MNIKQQIQNLGLLILMALSGLNTMNAANEDGFGEKQSSKFSSVLSEVVGLLSQANSRRRSDSQGSASECVDSESSDSQASDMVASVSSLSPQSEEPILSKTPAHVPSSIPQKMTFFSARSTCKIILAGIMLYAGYKLYKAKRAQSIMGRVKGFFSRQK